MKRASVWSAVILFAALGCASFGAPRRFEKVSEHCYYLQLREGAGNVGAVVTGEGTLLIDPPPEPDLATALEFLKQISSQPVRWAVFTDPHFAALAAGSYFARAGTVFLGTDPLVEKAGNSAGASAPAWFVFGRQMHLFPSGVEIRIFSLQHKAHTGADLVVLVPDEKVVFTGGLYEAARYPEIDEALDGNPLEWIDGMIQLLDAVPVLKPAVNSPKPKSEQPQTLEEGIEVISAHGVSSNLQNMKDLLEAVRKLRSDLAGSLKAGRSCDEFFASPDADPYRSYGNFEPYAQQLCAALSASPY